MFDASLSIREFVRRFHRAHLAETSYTDYMIQIGWFERYFKQQLQSDGRADRPPTLGDLSRLHIRAAVNARIDAGKTGETADKVRRVMLSIWNKAAELDEHDVIKPPGKLKREGKQKEYEPVAWTMEEFGRLLWGAEQLPGRVGPWLLSAWLPAVLWTVYNSGLRISSTMAIRRSWINYTSRRLVVDPDVQKDDEGRSVKLLPETIEALAPLMSNGLDGPFDDWPFDRGVQQWPALNLRLKKAIVAGGLAESIEQITRRDLWHKIRRTFATQIYIKTRSIEDVKRRLGHSSVEVSYRYVDFSQVEQAGEADLLPAPKPMRLRVVDGD